MIRPTYTTTVVILRALACLCGALFLSLSSDQPAWLILVGGVGLGGGAVLFWRAADFVAGSDARWTR